AYDPVAAEEAKHQLGDRIQYASNAYEALTGADALLLITEWREFRVPNWDRVKQALKNPVVFDGRNIYSGAEVRAAGFTYAGIGLK
ncbi:MAG: UDP-glucose/GDP-mannose dehydrogenase family protein, partial [Schleiferiaceae bacterium]